MPKSQKIKTFIKPGICPTMCNFLYIDPKSTWKCVHMDPPRVPDSRHPHSTINGWCLMKWAVERWFFAVNLSHNERLGKNTFLAQRRWCWLVRWRLHVYVDVQHSYVYSDQSDCSTCQNDCDGYHLKVKVWHINMIHLLKFSSHELYYYYYYYYYYLLLSSSSSIPLLILLLLLLLLLYNLHNC